MTDPERFQVELQFSAGAAYDPFGLAPSQPHVLPIKPRFPLFQGALRKPRLLCADVGMRTRSICSSQREHSNTSSSQGTIACQCRQ